MDKLPLTLLAAQQMKLQARASVHRSPHGMHFANSKIGDICYVGPCENGTRPVCYATENGCDCCVEFPDPVCSTISVEDPPLLSERLQITPKNLVPVVFNVSGRVGETKFYVQGVGKKIIAFNGVSMYGFIGSANVHGIGTEEVQLRVFFSGFAGDWCEGKVIVNTILAD